MQSYDLTDARNAKSVKDLAYLQSRELCYVRVASLAKLTMIDTVFLDEASRHTSQVFVSVPIDEAEAPGNLLAVTKLGVKGIALRTSYEEKKFLHHDRRGPERSGDLDLIAKVAQFRRQHPELEVVVEFELRADMRILAPTIAHLHQDGVKWVVLNAEGAPDKFRVSAFREMFEYLRIRGSSHLNVYFPFWSSHFREWDIKTQNTFSGLFEVHIDISNRCTHSCVFCGLYGPAALEDIKKDHGGQLSPRVSEFMKMEIDTDHCLGIIESLPWSVQVVQFGGAGDPLMHRDALKFIRACRERGFRVGVLSNMEYLEAEDLHELHSLGGKRPWELHIDANVSAGTPELYVRTRPRQTEKNFNKVVHNIEHLSALRERDSFGVYFTVMCVVTTVNCAELLDVAKLAVRVRAKMLWFKPVELHATFQAPLVPAGDHLVTLARSLREAVDFAEANRLEIKQRDYCDRIFNRHLGETHV